MKAVFDFAEGKLSYDEFEAELYLHPEIWTYLQSLIPSDITDCNCEFRKRYGKYAYVSRMEANGYSVKAALTVFGYDGGMTHQCIGNLLQYHYPEIEVRTPSEESMDDLLCRMKLEYIGGEEADELVRTLIAGYRSEGMKTLKSKIKEAFGITNGRKYPHWVQSEEWAFYEGRPMHFVSESHEGDLFRYVFRDDESGTETIIEQFA